MGTGKKTLLSQKQVGTPRRNGMYVLKPKESDRLRHALSIWELETSKNT